MDLCWTRPGKPAQNAYIERFNGTFRREALNAYSFANLSQVREVIDRWLNDYNTKWPHQVLSFLPPMEFTEAA
ncbi:integrase core domain-containing protein [Spirosoma luteolum]